MGIYSASKSALEGYTEALRMELRPFNIHVSMTEAAMEHARSGPNHGSTLFSKWVGNSSKNLSQARPHPRPQTRRHERPTLRLKPRILILAAIRHGHFRVLVWPQSYIISTSLRDVSMYDREEIGEFIDSK